LEEFGCARAVYHVIGAVLVTGSFASPSHAPSRMLARSCERSSKPVFCGSICAME
jgi:hypothetical protein